MNSSVVPLLVKAYRREAVTRPPLWLMRQAGRYLPEYRKVRANFSNFIQFCLTPDAATEVTLQPVNRFGLDAAIIFADILTIPHALGHTVTFTEGQGPSVVPIIKPADVDAMAARLSEIPDLLAPVGETIANTRAALVPEVAVIGFCGGPWTLACYLFDTKPSEGIPNTLAFAQAYPHAFTKLLDVLTAACAGYLSMQIEQGANAVQVFESWAGACPPGLWKRAVHTPLVTLARALREAHPETPTVLFPRLATQQQLLAIRDATATNSMPLAPTVLALSTEIDLSWAAQTLQPQQAIQGNLNPELFTLPDISLLQTAAKNALQTNGHQPGYVMNVGHGLTPQTRPESVQFLSDMLKQFTS